MRPIGVNGLYSLSLTSLAVSIRTEDITAFDATLWNIIAPLSGRDESRYVPQNHWRAASSQMVQHT